MDDEEFFCRHIGDLIIDMCGNKKLVGGGFGPPKASPTDLQSVPFDRSGTPPKLFI
jgi:hypothetical protein